MGVNHEEYNKEEIFSNSSCTTNCLAPLIKVIDKSFEVESCLFTTVHACTSSQALLDGSNEKGWRSGRSCLNNIIPTTTGASNSVCSVIPSLKG
jgi:glyceraldehyde 3-phosphate dehydrogenase